MRLHALFLILLFPIVANAMPGFSAECETDLVPEKPINAASAIVQAIAHWKESQGLISPASSASAATAEPPAPVLPPKTLAELKDDLKEALSRMPSYALNVAQEKITPIPTASIEKPLKKVRGFFSKMKEIFFERENLMHLLEATFIGEKSILILGPGGTAKSDVSDRIGENIVEDDGETTSYFSLQLTQDTTAAETQGGVVVEESLKGRMLRNWEEGVLGSMVVFLDEFFDGRLKFLRSFLKAFNERVYTQGRTRIPGITKVFIAASNKYLNQIYEMFGNKDPQALIDRFQFVYYSPGVLQDTSSILALARMDRPDMPKLKFSELASLNKFSKQIPMSEMEVLRSQAIFIAVRRKLEAQQISAEELYGKARARGERVQPPYRTTRVFSPRSLRISFQLVRVQALSRLGQGSDEQTVQVTAGDVDRLMQTYLAMQTDKADMATAEGDPYELSQLQTLQIEKDAVFSVVDDVRRAEALMDRQLDSIIKELRDATDDQKRAAALGKLLQLLDEVRNSVADINEAEKITPQTISALGVLKRIYDEETLKPLLN